MATYIPVSIIYSALCDGLPVGDIDRADLANKVAAKLAEFYASVDAEVANV